MRDETLLVFLSEHYKLQEHGDVALDLTSNTGPMFHDGGVIFVELFPVLRLA